jgi:hypothetical protein
MCECRFRFVSPHVGPRLIARQTDNVRPCVRMGTSRRSKRTVAVHGDGQRGRNHNTGCPLGHGGCMGVAATALRERRLDTVSPMNMCNPYPLPYVRHGELSCAGVRAAVGLGVRGGANVGPRKKHFHRETHLDEDVSLFESDPMTSIFGEQQAPARRARALMAPKV